MKVKSLFATKTFQGATLGLIGGIMPIIINCTYDHKPPTKKEAIAIGGLLVTFGWALIGRTVTNPVYTPIGLPGPNAEDFNEKHN